ncbi:MAG: permease prefix domain 1-containing protein [Candidatus Limnocylindrales bacterium]|jgi:hypothetical protein
MTIDWLPAFGFFGGGGALLITAVTLVRRCERRLGHRPDESGPPVTPGQTGADEISAYLDRMTTELRLPAADVAEVRAELVDHVHDSMASLEAEGFEPERAIREALGRLGPPAELGRQLRVAHQSTRRLLAGAGGGVIAAGGGFVLGYLGGIALGLLGFLAVFAVVALLAAAGVHLPNIIANDDGTTINSLLYATTLLVAAAVATRYAVRTSAGLSRRAPRTVAVFWAVAGALVFGWLAIFEMRGPQSWPGVALELCIPVVAIAAAFVRVERPMPHVGRWAIIVSAISLVVLSLGLVVSSGVSVSGSASGSATLPATSFEMSDLHLDTVAPMAPAAWLPEGIITGGGWGSDSTSGGTRVDDTVGADPAVPTAPSLKNWHEVRFEAWRALPMDEPGPGGIDTRYSAPLAIQPAVLSGNSLSAVFHFERLRDAGSWWVVLTAVGPDGHRYRIGDGGGGNSSFNGSAWDWLTAPQ